MVRRAIDEGRIVVEYQPIIDLRSDRPVSAEALVRIRDPEAGLRLPVSFLDVAEETGLLITIDELVLRDALKQAAAWRARLTDTGFAGVAVNVTARHLADVGFPQSIIDQLDALAVPGDHCKELPLGDRRRSGYRRPNQEVVCSGAERRKMLKAR